MHKHVEHVMGMAITIDLDERADDARPEVAFDALSCWFETVDRTFSTYRFDSEISRLGRGAISLDGCTEAVRTVLRLCDEVHGTTNGYFDVRATRDDPLDPSGLVKGWSVEEASHLLSGLGWSRHCINAGGDVRVRGDDWRVGIAHPFDRSALTTVVSGSDLAIATSGSSERGLHVIDPHTGRRAGDLASVTIIGPDLTFADAYATAAMAMGFDAPTWLSTLEDYEAYVIDAGGYAWWTEGFARYATGLTSPVG